MTRALLAVAALAACSPKASAPAIAVHVDRRVELVAIVERLAGEPEYTRAPATPYVADVDRAFAPFASHPAVAATRALHDQHGIAYDAPMDLAVHLDENLALRGDPNDVRWTGIDARAYAAQLADFAHAANLDAFLAAHRTYLDEVEQRFQHALAAEHPERWLAQFFGTPGARFVVVPAPLAGPMNYGVRSSDAMYEVMGGDPDLDLIVHEMAHSFINPLFDRHAAELIPAATSLMPFVAQAMKDNHYADARTLLNESGVRAVTALYVRDHGRTPPPDIFPWTPDLADLLARRDRARYPTLDAFVPELAVFFTERARVLRDQLSR